MSGGQLTLKANGTGSLTELCAVPIVWVTGMDKLMSQNVKHSH
jgi:hypothetical protein